MDAGDTNDAIVAVLRRGRLLLVIKRSAHVIYPGYWTPLSGRVRVGETHEAAVVREAFEEVGLVATPVEKIWECNTEDDRFRLHWWLAEASLENPTLYPEEVAEVRWIPPEEFGTLEPTFADDRRFFSEILPAKLGEHRSRKNDRGGARN